MDVLLRCINSAFFLSHDLRKDVEVVLVLQGPPGPARGRYDWSASELRYLNPDERSTGALIRNALMRDAQTPRRRSTPGIYVSTRTYQDVLGLLGEGTEIVYLKEDGTDIRETELPENVTFVLSDHMDLTPDEEGLLAAIQTESGEAGSSILSRRPLHHHREQRAGPPLAMTESLYPSSKVR